MTTEEWDAIALLLDECWKGEFTEAKSVGYKAFLLRHDAEVVMAALERIVQDGSPFLPAVAEIVTAINQLSTPAAATWTEVWPVLQKATGKSNAEQAISYVDEHAGRAAAHFYALEGHEVLGTTQFFCPDWGPARIEQLHKRWIEFSERLEERTRNGRALEAVQLRRGLGTPTRIDPLKALGLTPPAGELTTGSTP